MSRNDEVSSVSGFYGPGAYGAWLLTALSMIFRAKLEFEDEFTVLETLPVAVYGLIAYVDAVIRLIRLGWIPMSYASLEKYSALAAATYVTQVSFNLGKLFIRCYFGRGYLEDPGPLNLILAANMVILSFIMGGLTPRLTAWLVSFGLAFPQTMSLGAIGYTSIVPTLSTRKNRPVYALWKFLIASSWIPPLAFISAKRGPLVPILYSWSSNYIGEFLAQNLLSSTWVLIYYLGSLLLTPILMFGTPLRLWPETGAKLADLDQMVTFCSAIFMVLYQWKPKLKEWYVWIWERASRAFNICGGPAAATETVATETAVTDTTTQEDV